jgi:hypothetical protein
MGPEVLGAPDTRGYTVMTESCDREIRAISGNVDQNQTDLYQRIAQVQQLERRRRWAQHLCMAVLAMMTLAAVLAFFDYYFELTATTRVMGVLFMLVVGAVLLLRAQRHGQYVVSQAAADVESAFPTYGQRLRTSLDYADRSRQTSPASPAMLKALNAETTEMSRSDDFRRASSPSHLYRAVAICLAFVVVCSIFLLFVPELRIAAARVLLLPIEYTTVLLSEVEQPIPQGGDVTLEVEIRGRPVRAATVRYRDADGKDPWKELPLLPSTAAQDDSSAALHGILSATIADCQRDLELDIAVGSQRFSFPRIRVLQPLTLQDFSARVQPPAYTGRDAETFESEAFSVWEGSRVEMHFEMNRPLAQGTLIPEPLAGPNEREMAEMSKGIASVELTMQGNVAAATLASVSHSLRFTLDAKSADGITLDSPRYHIRVRRDKKPDIRFLSPNEELEVIPTTEVPLVVQAGDDLGVTKAGVFYKLSDGETHTLWEQDYLERQEELQIDNTLFLEDHPLTYRDAVTYYAYAEDRYFDQTRRVTTQLRFIDIRPFKRSFELTQASGGT